MTQSPKGPKPKRSGKPKENLTDKAQSERFIDAARELEVERSFNTFEKVIERVLSPVKK